MDSAYIPRCSKGRFGALTEVYESAVGGSDVFGLSDSVCGYVAEDGG